ncbi:MAG: class I SAM-dependent methyltransferase [Pseudomonadota bacterium]
MPLFKRTLSEFIFRRFMLKHYASNLLVDMNLAAKQDTLDYIMKNMPDAPYFEKHKALVGFTLDNVEQDGLHLEFGVGRGKSMRWIAPRVSGTVYGFDSFEGIQEHWNGNPIGSFAQNQLPNVPDNVEFVKGYFDATLPGFLEQHAGPIAFLHVDCDLYSSTVTIFEQLGRYLQPGAIILFDEYYNFHRWQQHEFKAFQEFVQASGLEYEYIAFSVTGQQVAVRVTRNPTFTE